MSRREQSRLADALPDLASAALGKIAALGAIALAATLLYFAYALVAGYVAHYPQLPWDQRVKISGNLGVAAAILVAATCCVVIYALVYLWEHEELPVWLLLGGLLLYFAPPFILAEVAGIAVPGNRAALIVHGGLTRAGQVLLLAALVRIVPILAHHMRTGFAGLGEDSATRRAARKQPGILHPFSPCWRLPYCRPYIQANCVRYKEKKTCWRTRSGCMCDDAIMAAALMGGGATRAASREKLMLEFLPGGGAPGVAARRLQCRNCFIYLEHQRVKHRYVTPLAVLAFAGVLFVGRGVVDQAYAGACAWATRMLQAAALGQVNTGVIWETFTNPAVKWLVLLCAGLFALAYFLKLLEYVFFKLKI